MSAPWFLEALGLTDSTDERAIKRAYASRLKTIDPAIDPADFARLRDAFERAKAWIEHREGHAAETQGDGAANATQAHDDAESIVVHFDDSSFDSLEEQSPDRPLSAEVSHDIETSLATLATSLVNEPATGTRVLLYRVAQRIRQQHVDAQVDFEQALIDALSDQRLVRRTELFASAVAEFAWNEVGRLDTLGRQRCAWIEQVLASEIAWKALPERRREKIMNLIAEAEKQQDVIPDRLLGAWPEVDAYMAQYGAWLRFSLSDGVRKRWSTQYLRVPASKRKKLERAAERAAALPSSWRRWLTLGSGWSWGRMVVIFMLLRALLMVLREMGITGR